MADLSDMRLPLAQEVIIEKWSQNWGLQVKNSNKTQGHIIVVKQVIQ